MGELMFNRGFLCKECGPIPKAKTRSKNRIKRETCPDCMGVVTPWERPMNERPGRCLNCAYAGFKLAVVKGVIVRACKRCNEAYSPETKQVIRKGKEEFKYVAR